ncbi:PLP-dependent aminotransferase family protein [Polymorphum gilvum]|uniref:Transcriptional regulator, GntR family protein n=1 Tax=Polymorphum gilvum (strain LMG 25793 / CGMCC 1.9160 / SL003B-26A1) TaxID=991905 RepID=F2IY61_POLGS|nr:PLP-dependent aminotransferase family protein [Polymorphum gilvum]ADZ71673.1 Transcriptional regulator, GntR family protein [Polymorphum gilvum SL003B-26A1]
MDGGKPRLSRVDQIVENVALMFEAGAYKPFERLPSIRQAAREYGVSKNTMAEAYDRLVARGLLEARPGSGYYMAQVRIAAPMAPAPHVAAAIDGVSLLREQLEKHYEVRPGDGRPPPLWMEGSELRRHFAHAKAPYPDAIDFGYGSSWGYGPLRDRLRVQLLERSISAQPEGLLLIHGVNHGLDLIIRHLIEPGDTVFVDEPGYYPLFAKLTFAKAEIVGIRRERDGPDLDDLASKLAVHKPKMFVTQSHGHNPTGSSLSPARAFGLMQLAERWGFLLVENDALADILPATLPRLAALDQLNRVLYLGTFSKTLSASLRCGYIAGNPAIVRRLADIKMVTLVNSSDHVERFVFNLIQAGHYLRHLRRLKGRVEDAYKAARVQMEGLGLSVMDSSIPGFYLWTEFPDRVIELELCRAAAERSIFISPGSVFHPNRKSRQTAAMRVNVAYATDPRFIAFLADILN